MLHRLLVPSLAVLALATIPWSARADRRYYGETYNAATSPPGGVDVELWSTLHQPPKTGGLQVWRHQLELETGITPRWDVALYNVFRYDQGGTTRYEATKLETRYRLSDYGAWFVDPVLYFEVQKEWIDDKPLSLEGKLILAKDMGPLNVSVNGWYEIEFIPGGELEHEWAYAVGSSYEVVPWMRLGAELFGAWTRVPDGTVESTHWAGPALSLAYGRMWLVVAAGFGLTDESEKLRLRSILAFQF